MKTHLVRLLVASLGLLAVNVPAAVHYVDLNCTNPVPPYTGWSTAATNIQDAVDAAIDGDEVLVTNGVYQTGGRPFSIPDFGPILTNRVVITNVLTLKSVNGPAVTFIVGNQVPGTINDYGAVRCVDLVDGATLSGFTITNGATGPGGSDAVWESWGGGLNCQSGNGVVTNCIIVNNSAGDAGGGAVLGTFYNCQFIGNQSGYGGGVAGVIANNCMFELNSGGVGGGAGYSTLNNCTLTGNSASGGGGADSSTLNNCIVFYNTAPGSDNYSSCTLNFSCTTPLPDSGTNNITAEPQLTDPAHISSNSPCIGAGSTNYSTGVDIDGEAWRNPPSIGCDEYYSGAITGALSVALQADYTNVASGFVVNFTGQISGRARLNTWDFGDGTVVSNQLDASHSWVSPGEYPVVLTVYNDDNPGGVSATVAVYVAQGTNYVSLDSTHPVSPYLSWDTAATNIQDAVDAALPGGTILVTNGVYGNGGRVVYGTLTNRVVINRLTAVTVESVNGPAVTVIQGYQDPVTTNGDDAVRCVFLGNGSRLMGFTLTGGATRNDGDGNTEQSGGGLWCDSTSVVASNCVLTGNSAANAGGGASGGTLDNCTFIGNSASYGGGVCQGTLNNCTLSNNSAAAYGGAAYNSMLANCVLSGNFASGGGGGTCNGTANNCTLSGNFTGDSGGAAYGATLNNCSLSSNGAANAGGGTCYGALSNCTLTGNSATNNGGGAYQATLSNCTLTDNSASYGGGANGCGLTACALTGNSAANSGGGAEGNTLNNCTLTGNSAFTGGGADSSTLNNCIVYYNSATRGDNQFASTLNYCCTTPLPASGAFNIATDPQMTDLAHISATSPCIGAGSTNYSSGVDIDGEPWLNPPSIGCDEYYSGVTTGALSVGILAAYTNVATGFTVNFAGQIDGHASLNTWDFGDGTVVSNSLDVTHVWSAPGDYAVVLTAFNDSNPGGVSATVVIHVAVQPVYYVALINTNPVAPYDSWATAATNIQDAIDAASVTGSSVLVSNGTYQTGGRVVYGSLTNRVVIDKAVTVQSVNGPAVTLIQGYQDPVTTNGDAAVRCVYLANNGSLVGFTLTNGATRIAGDGDREQSGGGVWCESSSPVVSNCVLSGNSAAGNGGGAIGGTLNNCTLTGNSTYNSGGGVYASTLNNCTLATNTAIAGNGGGAGASTLNNCTLTGNSAANGGGLDSSFISNSALAGNSASSGGAANQGTLINCTLSNNSVDYYGGAAYGATLDNCLLSNNRAAYVGGGASYGTANNCVLAGNSAGDSGGAAYGTTLNNCRLSSNRAANLGGGTLFGNLSNCSLTGNSATHYGGGAYAATLNNCSLSGNSAFSSGGGVEGSTLDNCTLTGNSAFTGGGADGSTLNNCIVYYNNAPNGSNYSSSVLNFCCTTPLPDSGTNNIIAEPQLADFLHLSAGSPCIGAGSTIYSTGVDIDGEPWASPPSIGCDEYYSGAITGALSVAILADYTNVASGFAVDFTAQINGHASANVWNFGDGTVVSNRPYASHSWGVAGDYVVVLTAYNETYPGGLSATITIHVVAQPVQYVALNSTNPVPPYLSWDTAATNIQNAVDVAVAGGTILVTNGVYGTGGRVLYGAMTNRVAITRLVTVRSVNGPASTVIQGNPIATNAVRCVYLANGAALAGFTLTNGATRNDGDTDLEQSGGGIWCESAEATISNCVIIGNSAVASGGGAFRGTLNDCTLTGNSANAGGGASGSTLISCTFSNNSAFYGGGADASTLNDCTLTGNSAHPNFNGTYGGGANSSTLNNCVLTGNSAAYGGGGASSSILNQCILTGNSAPFGTGGGAYSSTLNNCLLYANSAGFNPAPYGAGGGAYSSTLNNCLLCANWAGYGGGGADNATLNNCTIVNNSSGFLNGGADNVALNNCIVYYNNDGNYGNSTLNYCCTIPDPGGTGNITNAPLFVDFAGGNLRLQSNSPCINSGNNTYAPGPMDLDGNPRIVFGTVDIGAYEYQTPTSIISYAWLQQYGLPTDGSADHADLDGTGMNVYQDWVASLNPTNALSVLKMLPPAATNNPLGLVVSWQSVSGITYFLQSSTNLGAQPAFSAIQSNIVGQAGTTSYTDTTATNGGPYFYRVGVQQ